MEECLFLVEVVSIVHLGFLDVSMEVVEGS